MSITNKVPLTSEFTRMANVFAKADHRTFHALRQNTMAQRTLQEAQKDFEEAFETFANYNMDIMNASTFEAAMEEYDSLRRRARFLMTVLRKQQMAAKYVIEARFPDKAFARRSL